MDVLIFIICLVLCVTALVGCFLPVIPGPPLAYFGYLLLALTPAADNMTAAAVVVLGALTLLSVVLDYVIPSLGVKWFGGTKYGKWGSVAGTFAGLLFLPWGLIVGPFAGAFVGELLGKSDTAGAFKSGLGSLVGFICGTFFKVLVTIAIACYSAAAIF